MSQTNTDDNSSLGAVADRFFNHVRTQPDNKMRTNAIMWFIGAIVLGIAASFPISNAPSWYLYVQTIIGFPAGILLFCSLVVLKEKTKINNWAIFNKKSELSHLQRIKTVGIVAVIIAATLLVFSSYIPYGAGGAFIVCVIAIFSLFLRRTPQEIRLAKLGVVDPRDVEEDGTIATEAILNLENDDHSVNVIQNFDENGNVIVTPAQIVAPAQTIIENPNPAQNLNKDALNKLRQRSQNKND